MVVWRKSMSRPFAVPQAALVEHLEEHVLHAGVCLLHLVQQQHAVRPAAHGLGQHAALAVADVAGRGAHQHADLVLLLELGQVDGGQRLRPAIHLVGQRQRGLGLAHAARPHQHEHRHRLARDPPAGRRTLPSRPPPCAARGPAPARGWRKRRFQATGCWPRRPRCMRPTGNAGPARHHCPPPQPPSTWKRTSGCSPWVAASCGQQGRRAPRPPPRPHGPPGRAPRSQRSPQRRPLPPLPALRAAPRSRPGWPEPSSRRSSDRLRVQAAPWSRSRSSIAGRRGRPADRHRRRRRCRAG